MLAANRLPVSPDEAIGLVVDIHRAIIDDDPIRDRCQDGSFLFGVLGGSDRGAEDLRSLFSRDGQRAHVWLGLGLQSGHRALQRVDPPVELSQARPQFLDAWGVLAALLDDLEQLATPPLGPTELQQQRGAAASTVFHPFGR
ncbi:hypothetical protein [Roseateles sp. LKC17W]|uniref:Uncharacterized protein n=1 Tax=Pelomonas margarita TaxID=3299031 RepID=A0ABW7FFK6_9BURK